MSASAKRARTEDLVRHRAMLFEAYLDARTPKAEHDAYARLRWHGYPPMYGEAPDPPNPPGWATLENVR